MERGLIIFIFQLEDFFVIKYKYDVIMLVETRKTVENINEINFRPVLISKGFRVLVKSTGSISLFLLVVIRQYSLMEIIILFID